MRGCASSAIAMHSSRVSKRPATCVGGCIGFAGVSAGGAGGCVWAGACALAMPVNATKTTEAIGVNHTFPRGLDIGTREYHAALGASERPYAPAVDNRWMRGGYLFP